MHVCTATVCSISHNFCNRQNYSLDHIFRSCRHRNLSLTHMDVCNVCKERYDGKVLFSQASVCSHLGGTPSPSHNTSTGPMSFLGGQVPHLHSIILALVPCTFWRYPPSQVRMGGTPTVLGWGTPPPPSKDNRRNICYVAGGMPLVLTQEDFLV